MRMNIQRMLGEKKKQQAQHLSRFSVLILIPEIFGLTTNSKNLHNFTLKELFQNFDFLCP